MKFQDIRKMAKDMDISTHRMNKIDVIRAIQQAENNIDCYGTDRIDTCQEHSCLWRIDCENLNNSRKQ